MKKTLKYKTNYIFGALLTIIGIGTPFLIWGIVYSCSGNRDFPYHMTMLIIGISLCLFAMVIGDVPIIIFKLKATEIDTVVPEELTLKSWRLRWPFIISGVLTLLTICVFWIIFLITKQWPLL